VRQWLRRLPCLGEVLAELEPGLDEGQVVGDLLRVAGRPLHEAAGRAEDEAATAGLLYSMTMVVVSHEMGFARAAAHRILFMDEGQIIEENTPSKLYDSPTQERTKLFLSKILH
jgi:hypothetical protein